MSGPYNINDKVDASQLATAATANSVAQRDASGQLIATNLITADKIIHDGDTDTAIRFPAADTVTVETNGATRLRINPNGYVGIGSASPNEKFTVSGEQNATAIAINVAYGSAGEVYSAFRFNNTTSANGNSEIRNIVNGAASTGSTLSFLTTQTGGNTLTERMRITSSGNVGIGTTSPSSKLHVSNSFAAPSTGGISADTLGIFSHNGAPDSIANISLLSRSSAYSQINFGNQLIENAQFIRGGSTYMSFSTGSSGAAGAERMRIDASGNVGIGTSSPTAKLHVSGTSVVSGTANFGAGINLTASGAQLTTTQAGVTTSRFSTESDGTAIAVDGAWSIKFKTNSAERMRINSSGNVLVGKTADNVTVAGLELRGAGEILFTRNGDMATFNRLTTDGEAVRFRKDNTTVGSIGAASGGIYFGSGSSATERMRIDASGNVLVGTTTAGSPITATTGGAFSYRVGNELSISRQGGNTASPVAILNQTGVDGQILEFRKDGTTVGSISAISGQISLNSVGTGSLAVGGTRVFNWDANQFYPFVDDARDLGFSTFRWDDIYATNGTIQTSDRNEKQDIEELSEAEHRVAVACKGLLRKFRWISSVEEKGDDARIHFGVIAQDLQAAFEAEGLDAGRYAMFIHTDWWEHEVEMPAVEAQDAVYETVVTPAEYDEEGNEVSPETTEQRLVSEAVEGKEAYTRTDTYYSEEEAPEGSVKKSRMGVRYSELLAFIIAGL